MAAVALGSAPPLGRSPVGQPTDVSQAVYGRSANDFPSLPHPHNHSLRLGVIDIQVDEDELKPDSLFKEKSSRGEKVRSNMRGTVKELEVSVRCTITAVVERFWMRAAGGLQLREEDRSER